MENIVTGPLTEVKEKKVTTKEELEKVEPTADGVMVVIRSWPAQTASGVLVPDQYQVIRAEKYVGEVVRVGDAVTTVKEGEIIVFGMYSGHHIVTKTGHAKIIKETDVLMKKETAERILYPDTFEPGIDYILVKIHTPKEIISEAGLIVPAGQLSNDHSKQDVATRTAEVLAVGPKGDTPRNRYNKVKVGTTVIFDSYVGLDLPVADVSDEFTYKIMYIWDVIATIKH